MNIWQSNVLAFSCSPYWNQSWAVFKGQFANKFWMEPTVRNYDTFHIIRMQKLSIYLFPYCGLWICQSHQVALKFSCGFAKACKRHSFFFFLLEKLIHEIERVYYFIKLKVRYWYKHIPMKNNREETLSILSTQNRIHVIRQKWTLQNFNTRFLNLTVTFSANSVSPHQWKVCYFSSFGEMLKLSVANEIREWSTAVFKKSWLAFTRLWVTFSRCLNIENIWESRCLMVSANEIRRNR